jgi:hypothetical protein
LGWVGTLFQATGVIGHDQAGGMSGYYNIVSDIASNIANNTASNATQTLCKLYTKYTQNMQTKNNKASNRTSNTMQTLCKPNANSKQAICKTHA